MSEGAQLAANTREVTGKKVATLRKENLIPATVYEKGKDSRNVSVAYVPFMKVYEDVGMAQPVELELEGKKVLTMIKDVAVDPAKNTYLHVAFHAINKNDPVEAEVPVHLEGNVPAEQMGNFIVRPNDHVIIKALPKYLPEEVVVMADSLKEPGDHLTVADIIPIEHVEVLSDPDMVLITVEEPRTAEEPEAPVVDAADVPSEKGGTPQA